MNRSVASRLHWMRCFVLAVAFLAVAGGMIASTPVHANDSAWLHGTWHGERSGYPVRWHFSANGRMHLEDRGATWSVQHDTLVVDLDPLGKSQIAERAVYRFLTSSVQRGRRLLFLRGFDLGSDGLLLAREEERAEDAGMHQAGDTRNAGKNGDTTEPATNAPRRAP